MSYAIPAMRDPCCLPTRTQGKLTYCNSTFATLVGQTPGEALGFISDAAGCLFVRLLIPQPYYYQGFGLVFLCT